MHSFEDSIVTATDIMHDQPLLREVSGSALVAGDIHGDLDALNKVVNLRQKLNLDYLILLGDYVDRGEKQVGVIHQIAEEIANDDKFIALRGNHEDKQVCSRYGFFMQLHKHDYDPEPVMQFFSNLPNAAISDKVFMSHGGIPVEQEFEIEMINTFDRVPIVKSDFHNQILWNDPLFDGEEKEHDKIPSRRGPGIWNFGSSVTEFFLEKFNLDLILRAHIAWMDGAKWMHDKRILSLFTSQGGPYYNHQRKVAEIDFDKPSELVIHKLK